MTVVLIGLMPPPRPPFYRAGDIAAALWPSKAGPHIDRRLVRTEVASTNPPFQGRAPEDAPTERVLAQLLSVPESRIRVVPEWRPPPSRFWLDRIAGRAIIVGRMDGLQGPGAPPGPGGPAGPGDGGRWRPDGRFLPPPPRDEPGRPGFAENWPVAGRFRAALQLGGSRWVVVQPKPQGFPNPDQRRVGFWLFGCILLVTPLAYLFARRMTKPILKFAEAAEALGRDPSASPTNLSGPAEIERAARAFNEMQVRVHKFVEDRTQMMGAISHDLRTPLARIRLRVERNLPASREAILGDLTQMEQMIAQVLAFVRGASEPRERQMVELRSILECIADTNFAPGLVDVQEGPGVYVDADPLDLTRLFTNLVDNAVTYGQRARVSVGETGEEIRVAIEDDGPGLGPDDIERVFTPFYRADAARNLDHGGVGLGLSVARSIARAHGGDVALAPSAVGGLEAIVNLPVARACRTRALKPG